jgi:hypothetical protein
MCRLGLGEDELELTSEQADPLHLRWLAEHGSGHLRVHRRLRHRRDARRGDPRVLLRGHHHGLPGQDRSTIVAGMSQKDGPRRVIKLPESHIEHVVEAVRKLLRVKKRRAS